MLHDTSKLAGRFTCYAPPGFAKQKRRVLYIGKATYKEFADENASSKYFNHKATRFWDFACRIGVLANPNLPSVEDKALNNVAWSNIFKQGVVVGNPERSFAKAQSTEAVNALREEVRSLRPTLIVSANASNSQPIYEEIVREAFRIERNAPPPAGMDQTVVPNIRWDIWSRPAFREFPPIVWTWHPERKSTVYIDAALEVIRRVAGW